MEDRQARFRQKQRAKKTDRVTLSRFVESTSTKRRRYSLDVMLFVISRSNRSLSRSHRNTWPQPTPLGKRGIKIGNLPAVYHSPLPRIHGKR
jgi:hypothetical protein